MRGTAEHIFAYALYTREKKKYVAVYRNKKKLSRVWEKLVFCSAVPHASKKRLFYLENLSEQHVPHMFRTFR